MKIHHLTVAESLRSLDSRPEGLSSAEAERRLHEFGPNAITHPEQEPLARQFLRQFTHFFALILWGAASLAFVAERYEPSSGMATLGLAILGVILINGLFSFSQEYRARQAIASLRQLLPNQVKALREGQLVQLQAAMLVPGDVVVLEEGDQVPADGRVLESHEARVNNATITGESAPEPRQAAPSAEAELVHSSNVVLAGTFLTTGRAQALVFATGMQTEFGRIAHLTQTAGEGLSPLQREISRLARIVAVLATGLGVAFFFIGRAMHLPPWENLLFAIGIIVANVPEGLLPTVTLSLAMASQRMARRNALVRNLISVETLGSTTVICTDKTGTLTENRMAAKMLYVEGSLRSVSPEALRALRPAHRRLFEGARLCQNVKEVRREDGPELAGDPMELALVAMGTEALPGPLEAPREDELPFDPERKRLSTLHRTSEGRVLHTKGALETLLPLCREVQTEVGPRELTDEVRERFLRTGEQLARQGLRVLAFAWRYVAEQEDRRHLEEGLVLSGLVGLEDPIRPEVPEAIQRCREAGIRVIVVTGDHPRTAEAVARAVGLVRSERPVVLTSTELRKMSDTQLQIALNAPEVLFARVAPGDKQRVVAALKRKREIVAVTGDGVNDAPALKEAHIGIAMGRSGTDVAREAADVVLADDHFASIVNAIEEGRAVFMNIRKFLTYILTSNVPELVPYLAFVLFRIPLPLTILQILAVDLGTDMLPALALGAEPPHPGVMRQPPSAFRRRLLDGGVLVRAYLFLGIMEATAGMAAFFFVLGRGGWSLGAPLAWNAPLHLQAMTACLGAIVVMQVANVLLCRTARAPTFSMSPLRNRLLLLGVGVELLLLVFIVYTPWGNHLFATAPLPVEAWLFMLPFALGMLALEELRKAWVRRAPVRERSLPRGRRRWSAAGLGLVAGLVLASPARAEPRAPVEVEVFTREGCPRCKAARDFLTELQLTRPWLQVRYHDVGRDSAARAWLESLAAERSLHALGVPAFHVRGQLLIGFSGPETSGHQLLALIEGQEVSGGSGEVCPAGEAPATCAPTAPVLPPDTLEAPWVGRVSVRELGLPAFTVLMGLIDGFNPCAMWVLLFLLSLLVNLHDRRKMFVVGGTFVLTSGIVYFLFMAAWLNVFLFVGLSRVTQMILGAVALGIGLLNLKDFFAFHRGPTLSIPERARPGLYARTRRLIEQKPLLSALGGVVVLALLVNLVELACTAGLPAVYTQILALRKLPTWQYYAYLVLYNVAYIADDTAMLVIAVVTLSRRKLQERAGRWLKLLSGGVMFLLGLLLLFWPRALLF